MNDALITSRGKGWYEVRGEKVRGYQNAVRAAKNGGAENVEADEFTLQRLDFLRQAGLQYAGSRDVYAVAGYKANPAFDDYWSYYDRHPIAGRIVDMPAQTTWRHPPLIVEPDQEDGTEFTEAFEALADRLGLWSRFERVDRLSRVGQYGVLFVGVRGSDDLAAPVERLSKPEDVAYLMHFSQQAATVETWVTDTGDERYGMPELYRVDFSRRNATFTPGAKNVHWSRILHVAEDPLLDDIYGRPVLRRVLNTIFNDEKVDAASAEAFWQLADQILQLKIDPEATGVDFDAVDTKLKEIYHDLRRQFSLQGGELSWLGGDSPDPSAISEVLATKMAAGANIPKRILFGSERGELASTQDERNFFGTISERQEHHAEPNILRAFVDRLIEFGALPRPGEDGYQALWPPLYVPSDAELSEQNKATAETASALTPIGGDPYELVEVDEDGMVILRPSSEVWEERDRMPGDPLEIVDPMGDEPPADTGDEEEEEPEEEAAA